MPRGVARIKQLLQTAQTSYTVYRYTVCGITGYTNSASACMPVSTVSYGRGLVSHTPLAAGGLWGL